MNPVHPLLRPLVTQKPVRKRPRRGLLINKVPEFLSYADPGLVPSSQAIVRKCLGSLSKGLGDKEPTPENLRAWLRQRLAVDRVSTATLSLERTYANRFFEWCIQMGYLDKNPLKPIPHVPIRRPDKPTISDAQYKALLKAAEGSCLWAVITVAWYTGARSIDICNLTWDNINFDTNVLRFIPIKTSKSGRLVELTMVPELRAVFKDWAELDGLPSPGVSVFPDAKQIHDRGDGSFQYEFRKCANLAGLPKTVTFHCLRHTRATRMLSGDNQVSPLVAADVLGLSSLSTLRRYAKISLEEKEKAMKL